MTKARPLGESAGPFRYRFRPGRLASFLRAAIFVWARPPIAFGAVARLVAPTARRGAGRPAACRAFFFGFFAVFFFATFFVSFLTVLRSGDFAWLRVRAPDVLRVAPALERVARAALRPLRLSIVLVCAAARLAAVRAEDPARAAASPAALAVDDSVLAARPSIDPTASAPRSTIVIVVSAACESGSPGRVVLLSAIRKTSSG